MRRNLFLLLIFLSIRAPLFPQEKFRKSPPFPEPLQELRLPTIESAILTNGLTLSVAFRENPSLISMQLVILAGESSSPQNLPGAATFTANMLSRGTLSLSSSRIEEMIESIGGNFSISTSPDYSLFTLNFLEEYLDKGLEILSKMILEPTFLEREIEYVKRTMFYDLLDKTKDPEFLAKRLLLQLLFKNHPYSKANFNEDFIRTISRKDVLSFFNKYYSPNNAILVLSGNLNLSTASKKVSHYFNTWQNKDLERLLLPPPSPNEKEKVCLIDFPQAKDCTIYLGNVVFPITSSDFFPFTVLNQVLGGTPNSRLFMNLRESKGYAYFAFSEAEFYKGSGIFFIKAKVTPEAAYASLQEILKEIKNVTEEKILTFEIEQAKSYLIGNFPLKIERFDHFSSRISDIKAFRLGEEHWNKYYENIMLVDSEKVYEVAQKFSLLNPIIVVVGDKNIILDSLKEFEKVEVYDYKGILQYTLSKGEDE